jgi:protein-S-isoprenylcysteine O-methyltransferase Ste14
MRPTLGSTSTRTFVAIPLAVAAEQLASRRRVRPGWLPVAAAGYLLYRLAGSYRLPRAGGPRGMSQGMPERLVTDGPYALTRNPMYLGHLVFLGGLTLTTRSPLALAATASLLPWFGRRARADERRLIVRFGSEFADYCRRVPRWLPGTPPRPPDRHTEA